MARQTTRMRKVECPDCGYLVRVARKWIAAGLPTCPCGGQMMPDDLEDQMFAPGDTGREAYAQIEVARIQRDIRSEHSKAGEWKRRRCANDSCGRYIPKTGPKYCTACGGDHFDPLAHVKARYHDDIPF